MLIPHRSCTRVFLIASLAFSSPAVGNAQGVERPRVPLRTALDELRVLRESYTEAFNKQDMAARMAIYAPDAVVIRGDGTVLTGKDAIQTGFETAPPSGVRPTMRPAMNTDRMM